MSTIHQSKSEMRRAHFTLLLFAASLCSAIMIACSGPSGPTLNTSRSSVGGTISGTLSDSAQANNVTLITHCTLGGHGSVFHEGTDAEVTFAPITVSCLGPNGLSNSNANLVQVTGSQIGHSVFFQFATPIHCALFGEDSTVANQINGPLRCYFAPGGNLRHFIGPFKISP